MEADKLTSTHGRDKLCCLSSVWTPGTTSFKGRCDCRS